MTRDKYLERQKQIAELEANRRGYVDGLGSDDYTDKCIAIEVRLIDLKLECLRESGGDAD